MLGHDAHDLLHRHADGSPVPRERCALRSPLHGVPAEEGSDEYFQRADGTTVPIIRATTPPRPRRTPGGAGPRLPRLQPPPQRRRGDRGADHRPGDPHRPAAPGRRDLHRSGAHRAHLHHPPPPRPAAGAGTGPVGRGRRVPGSGGRTGTGGRPQHHPAGPRPATARADDRAARPGARRADPAHQGRPARPAGGWGTAPGLRAPARRDPPRAVRTARRPRGRRHPAAHPAAVLRHPHRGPHGGEHPSHTEAEVALPADIGRRVGLVLDNARLYHEQQNVAETMQRQLLTPLPQVDHLRMAARRRTFAWCFILRSSVLRRGEASLLRYPCPPTELSDLPPDGREVRPVEAL